MSWNIGDNRNLFLKLKSKLGLYYVVLTVPKTAPEKFTLTVVGMQQLPNIEKADSKEELSCLTSTIYNGRRKVCLIFQTDTDNLNTAVYRYRKIKYLKDKFNVYLLSYIDIFYNPCIVLDETTVQN